LEVLQGIAADSNETLPFDVAQADVDRLVGLFQALRVAEPPGIAVLVDDDLDLRDDVRARVREAGAVSLRLDVRRELLEVVASSDKQDAIKEAVGFVEGVQAGIVLLHSKLMWQFLLTYAHPAGAYALTFRDPTPSDIVVSHAQEHCFHAGCSLDHIAAAGGVPPASPAGYRGTAGMFLTMNRDIFVLTCAHVVDSELTLEPTTQLPSS
jgi:hypothetical protein